MSESLEREYLARRSRRWQDRLRRILEPPAPYYLNREEPAGYPLGRYNLYIGGAGQSPDGYINLDLLPFPGVHIAASVEALPFRDDVFTRVECDAVLEHVRCPEKSMREIRRVLAPGGCVHLVTPFCHPFHEYPKDYRRFTPDGLKAMAGDMEVLAEGWRTGPTATLLVFVIEYTKLLLPFRAWRVLAHGVLGWTLFPLRYVDRWLLRSPRAARLGNHCYVWLRKP